MAEKIINTFVTLGSVQKGGKNDYHISVSFLMKEHALDKNIAENFFFYICGHCGRVPYEKEYLSASHEALSWFNMAYRFSKEMA